MSEYMSLVDACGNPFGNILGDFSGDALGRNLSNCVGIDLNVSIVRTNPGSDMPQTTAPAATIIPNSNQLPWSTSYSGCS